MKTGSQPIIWDTLRSIDATTLTANYQAIGTALGFASIKLDLQNLSDQTIVLTDDPAVNKLRLPAGAYRVYDITLGNDPWVRKGTIIYVKHDGVVPTTGTVDVAVWHKRQQ